MDLEHLEKGPPDEIEKPNDQLNFLPHHCVKKIDSTTTKFRVVFDGSTKSDNGTSLNSSLMVGPTIQQDIFSLLIRFRLHRVAFTADIHPNHQITHVNMVPNFGSGHLVTVK